MTVANQSGEWKKSSSCAPSKSTAGVATTSTGGGYCHRSVSKRQSSGSSPISTPPSEDSGSDMVNAGSLPASATSAPNPTSCWGREQCDGVAEQLFYTIPVSNKAPASLNDLPNLFPVPTTTTTTTTTNSTNDLSPPPAVCVTTTADGRSDRGKVVFYCSSADALLYSPSPEYPAVHNEAKTNDADELSLCQAAGAPTVRESREQSPVATAPHRNSFSAEGLIGPGGAQRPLPPSTGRYPSPSGNPLTLLLLTVCIWGGVSSVNMVKYFSTTCSSGGDGVAPSRG